MSHTITWYWLATEFLPPVFSIVTTVPWSARHGKYGTRPRLKLFTANPKSIRVGAGDWWWIDNIQAVFGIVPNNWNVSYYEIKFKQTFHIRFPNIGKKKPFLILNETPSSCLGTNLRCGRCELGRWRSPLVTRLTWCASPPGSTARRPPPSPASPLTPPSASWPTATARASSLWTTFSTSKKRFYQFITRRSGGSGGYLKSLSFERILFLILNGRITKKYWGITE